MQKVIQDFFGGLLLFGPIRMIRIIWRGGQEIAKFRSVHGREPTEPEWIAISHRVDEEVNGKR